MHLCVFLEVHLYCPNPPIAGIVDCQSLLWNGLGYNFNNASYLCIALSHQAPNNGWLLFIKISNVISLIG